MSIDSTVLKAQDIHNIQYGSSTQQIMDVYLPANRNSTTKTFILVHGGGWSGGSKSQLDYLVTLLKKEFPQYAIVNINYRLATAESPAFPKQIEDLQMAIDFIKKSDYGVSNQFAFIGVSAGAHLAMLYSYKYDSKSEILALASIVGPTDFTDPYYTSHPYYHYAALYLLGSVTNTQEAAIGISPAVHVSATSAPTIMFYGGKDPMVPESQARRLKAKLDAFNIPNKLYLFNNGGHVNWNPQVMANFQIKLTDFLREHF